MVIAVQARYPRGDGPADVITIGTSASAAQTGRFNTNQYGTLELLLAAVDAATPSVGGCTWKFLPGSYQFAGGYASTKDGIHVTGSRSATLINGSSGALGCMSFAGARSKLSEVTVSVANWVNSQKVMRFLAAGCAYDDVEFVGTAAGGNNTTPMTALELSGAARCSIRDLRVRPVLGLNGILIASSSNNTDVDGYWIGDFWSGSQRDSGIPIQVNDASHCTMRGGHLSGLGSVNNPMPFVARIWNTNGSDHHFKMIGCEGETLYAPRGIQVEAGRHCHFDSVDLANMPETSVGAFVVVDSTADGLGTTSSSVHFSGCTLHEIGKSGVQTGGAFYIGKANKTSIRNCVNETAMFRTLYADTVLSNDLYIDGLKAEAGIGLSTAALYAGAGNVSALRWKFRNFRAYGHTILHSAPTGYGAEDATNESFT